MSTLVGIATGDFDPKLQRRLVDMKEMSDDGMMDAMEEMLQAVVYNTLLYSCYRHRGTSRLPIQSTKFKISAQNVGNRLRECLRKVGGFPR